MKMNVVLQLYHGLGKANLLYLSTTYAFYLILHLCFVVYSYIIHNANYLIISSLANPEHFFAMFSTFPHL